MFTDYYVSVAYTDSTIFIKMIDTTLLHEIIQLI